MAKVSKDDTRAIKWPIYFKNRLVLGKLDSFVAIVTLWTPQEKIAEFLPKESFAVIGQLYSKRGINFLVRNLLANPKIKRLIVCGLDQTGSGKALVDLWRKKEAKDSILDKEIEAEAVRKLVNSIELVDLIGVTEEKPIQKAVLLAEPELPPREARIFPEPEVRVGSLFPAELDLVKIRRKTIGQTWLAALKHLLNFGLESEAIYHYFTKGENQLYEVLNLALVVEKEDPKDFKIYDFFPFKKNEPQDYIKKFFQKDRGQEPYTYGERLFDYEGVDQLAQMAKKLSQFSQDHGAMAVLWNPKIDNFPIRQPWRTPCLTQIQGQVYKNKLYLTAYFRSNDMFGAWPLNAFALRYLQGKLSEEIKVGLGSLITISNMAHLYDHDFAQATEIVKNNKDELCDWDPRGNLLIKVENKEIVVEQVSPEGLPLRSFRFDGTKPKAASSAGYVLEQAGCFSVIGHARDIGEQLAKAELAIKRGFKFEQDKELV
ncbi:MAG TPA: thymidylate synthase [Clostridia bacterium]|nr:thymidylate synthase [Clostridia bacterium]